MTQCQTHDAERLPVTRTLSTKDRASYP